MEDAPILVKIPDQKIFGLTSNKGNKFVFSFKNIKFNILYYVFLLFLIMDLSKHLMRLNFLWKKCKKIKLLVFMIN